MSEYNSLIRAINDVPLFFNRGFQSLPSLWYQYRNFDGFWSIIRSDSLWATDARFSNDSQEQSFAADIFEHRLKDWHVKPHEDYIVCFCGEDDKLSQWRGYAPNGGVSMGFSFRSAVPFYVINANKGADTPLEKDDYKEIYVQLGQVKYIPGPDSTPDQAYYDRCYNEICGMPGFEYNIPEYIQDFNRRASFIKHAGFSEENEWRLVFRNDGINLSECVRYKERDKRGIRRPYIVAFPGNPEYSKRACVVRICLSDLTVANDLKRLIQGELPLLDVGICRGDSYDKTDNFCFGCTLRCADRGNEEIDSCCYSMRDSGEYGFGVRSDENCVLISQGANQKNVYCIVHECVERYIEDHKGKMTHNSIPVWCEGHLPIRSLTVGPCLNQDEVEESIRHYCSHVYWLNDVFIKSSKIPFRHMQ